jgi:arylsulfatase A-like enzyme
LKDKPNIIFILSDDLSYCDIGCYGQKHIRTPNIDRLAKDGMRFTQAYAAASICGPSRCGLLTGKHMGHARNREHGQPVSGVPGGRYQHSLLPEDQTLGNVMQAAGYKTAAIGKWAVGLPGTEGVPNKKGFDHSFGFYDQVRAHSFYPEFVWRNNEPVVLEGNFGFDMHAIYRSNGRRFDADDPDQNTYDDEGRIIPRGVNDPDKVQNTYDLCEAEALEFIKDNADHPFFVYLAFQNPHGPLIVPSLEPYTNTDWPSLRHKEWGSIITRMDTGIGKITDLLESLEIADDTIICFASDNGYSAWGYFGMDSSEEVPFFDNKGPFRGQKFSLDGEGGTRVPFIVNWPGVTEGTVSDQPIAFWDVMPTLAEMGGSTCTAETDGISFVPTLLGEEQPQHDYLYWEQNHQQAVRMGQWKAFRPHPSELTQLYNLKHDPLEAHDVAGEHPDIVARIERIFIEGRTDSNVFINPGETEEHHRHKCEHLPANTFLVHNSYHKKWIEDFE